MSSDIHPEDWDRRIEEAARAKATEGAERAEAAGLEASARVARQRGSSADAIIDVAAELHAPAIVLGSRGYTGARSWIMGSVSHAVLQHADRPVIVIPSPEVASHRAAARADSPTPLRAWIHQSVVDANRSETEPGVIGHAFAG